MAAAQPQAGQDVGRSRMPLWDWLTLGSREVADRATRFWWVYLLTGVAWILASAIIFRFDYSSVRAISILFGVLAIAAGVMEVFLAFGTTSGWAFLHGLLAVIFIGAGIVSFFKPGDTFVALAAIISFYFVVAGTYDLIEALWSRHETDGWWVQAVSGIIQLGLGFWAAGYWNRSVALLIAFAGALALIRGVTQILFAFRLHEYRRELQPDQRAAARATTTPVAH
jgi:uncharacterized membrane protein HdeD (DUF308 family)